MQACQYYVGSFWLLPTQFNALLPPATLNASAVTTLLKQISMATGAEVVFKSMCFEVHGLEHEVRAAVSMIMELDIIKVGSVLLSWQSYRILTILPGLSS